ncbi:hypothetical protein [Pseudomonas aeruginosa]|uniref:hypothetical protein n=1 Tax=Pseudomonas aeruginosa TaxID=287 RepID=UPI00196915C7|nr:hypothetical protein [Pseudomonas aeruginosa]
MAEELKPVLWLELDGSATGLPYPPEMWWALCSSRIHYEQPAYRGKNPIFQLVAVPVGHVLVSEDLLRRIERECRRESDWNCENVPAGTKAATTRAKRMLEIANDLRDLLGEQEEGNDVSNHQ